MSKYTTQVRWIVESYVDEEIPLLDKINLSLPKIFDFDYPIWDENYRKILEKKIVMHYLFKEIGLETPEQWKIFLNERLNLIMPYYNQLYKTTVKDYDYLTDTKMTENSSNESIKKEVADFKSDSNISQNGTTKNNTSATATTDSNLTNDISGTQSDKITGKTTDSGKDTVKDDETSNTTNTKTDKNKKLESDYPQANYANLDYATRLVEDDGSASDTQENTHNKTSVIDKNNTTDITQTNDGKSSQKTTGTENTTSTNESLSNGEIKNTGNTKVLSNNVLNDEQNTTTVSTKIGNSGARSFTDLLVAYRSSLINIDKMIIDELKDLFMMIY